MIYLIGRRYAHFFPQSQASRRHPSNRVKKMYDVFAAVAIKPREKGRKKREIREPNM